MTDDAGIDSGVPPAPRSFEERMEAVAVEKGVTSLLFNTPSLAHWLYISPRELDVTSAFLKGMLDVMMQRGLTAMEGPITIRRLTSGLIAPGKEVFWCVKDLTSGEVYASGYVKDEAAARLEISNAILQRN